MQFSRSERRIEPEVNEPDDDLDFRQRPSYPIQDQPGADSASSGRSGKRPCNDTLSGTDSADHIQPTAELKSFDLRERMRQSLIGWIVSLTCSHSCCHHLLEALGQLEADVMRSTLHGRGSAWCLTVCCAAHRHQQRQPPQQQAADEQLVGGGCSSAGARRGAVPGRVTTGLFSRSACPPPEPCTACIRHPGKRTSSLSCLNSAHWRGTALLFRPQRDRTPTVLTLKRPAPHVHPWADSALCC